MVAGAAVVEPDRSPKSEEGRRRKRTEELFKDSNRRNFGWAELSNSNLSGTWLRGADFRGANLRGARLRDADLIGADFTGADLRDADLGDSHVGNAIFRNARMEGAHILAKLDSGQKVGWDKTVLEGAHLVRPDYVGLDKIGATALSTWLEQNKHEGHRLGEKKVWQIEQRWLQQTQPSFDRTLYKASRRLINFNKSPFAARSRDIARQRNKQPPTTMGSRRSGSF